MALFVLFQLIPSGSLDWNNLVLGVKYEGVKPDCACTSSSSQRRLLCTHRPETTAPEEDMQTTQSAQVSSRLHAAWIPKTPERFSLDYLAIWFFFVNSETSIKVRPYFNEMSTLLAGTHAEINLLDMKCNLQKYLFDRRTSTTYFRFIL